MFFKSGPFAWSGLIAFYIPVLAFCVWVTAMTVTVHSNLNKQFADGTEPGTVSHLTALDRAQ